MVCSVAHRGRLRLVVGLSSGGWSSCCVHCAMLSLLLEVADLAMAAVGAFGMVVHQGSRLFIRSKV